MTTAISNVGPYVESGKFSDSEALQRLRQEAIRSVFDEFCDVGSMDWNLGALETLGVVRPRPFGVCS